MLRISKITLGLACALLLSAQAPAPSDRVTVTGEKEVPRKIIDDFIASQAAPTEALDKMARWNVPVCPMAVGVPKDFARFVEKRVRDVAAQVGAPVGPDSCKQNVSILFTPEPQAVVNEIRRRNSAFMGYHHSTDEADRLARVTHPIQAWHMTGSRDIRGSLEPDNPRSQTNTLTITYPAAPPVPDNQMVTIQMPNARASSVTGSHLGNGLSSEFTHVLIVADRKWAADPEIGAIADAMAVLALSRPVLSDNCRNLPSILDLLAKDCTRAADTKAITGADLALLRGLYKMMPDAKLSKQRDEVAYQMQQSLAGH
jgi:hypothetical protein